MRTYTPFPGTRTLITITNRKCHQQLRPYNTKDRHTNQSATNTTLQYKHLHRISPRCLTHCTTGHRGQLNTHYHLTTYPWSPQSIYDMTIDCNKTDEHLQTTRKPTGHNLPDTESAFAQTTITPPPNIHYANIILTNIILMADKHNIPKHEMHSNCRLLPNHIVCKITQINNMRRANICDPALKLFNKEITSDIHKLFNYSTEHLHPHSTLP